MITYILSPQTDLVRPRISPKKFATFSSACELFPYSTIVSARFFHLHTLLIFYSFSNFWIWNLLKGSLFNQLDFHFLARWIKNLDGRNLMKEIKLNRRLLINSKKLIVHSRKCIFEIWRIAKIRDCMRQNSVKGCTVGLSNHQ